MKLKEHNRNPNPRFRDLPSLSTEFIIDREFGKGSKTIVQAEAEPLSSRARVIALAVYCRRPWVVVTVRGKANATIVSDQPSSWTSESG
jgi:hypothetical protein